MVFNQHILGSLFLLLAFMSATACEDIEDVESADDYESMNERLTGAGVHQTSGYKSVGMVNWCTGTLINGYTVLSAAHCVPKQKGKRLTFTLGKTKYPVATYYRHPDYRNTEHHDVGLFILKQRVKNVQPSPVSRTPAYPGTRITLVGMGSTGGNGNYWMTKKYVGTNTVHQLTPQWFSYRGDARNCSGDSGGPAFVGDAIVGVVSTGDGNNCSRSIGYNARTDDAVAWIASRAKGSVKFVSAPSGGGGGNNGGCSDTPGFVDVAGWKCFEWVGYDCGSASEHYGFTAKEERALKNNCKKSCGYC